MPWDSPLPIYLWAAVFILLTVALFRVRIRDRITPFFLYLDYLLIFVFFGLVVNFAIINYWLRFLPALPALLLLFKLFDRWLRKPWTPATTPNRVLLGAGVVILLVMGFANLRVLRSYSYPTEPQKPVLLAYPLVTGMYVTANGGNGLEGVGMNEYLHTLFGRKVSDNTSLAYAVDFMEIRSLGSPAESTLSTDRNEYEGWEDPVYAPCPGQVVYVESGHPDQKPFSEDSGYFLGNHVVVQCFEYYVTLGSLKNVDPMVQVGDRVSMNRIVGYLGVSGSPAVPHLHVHATVDSWGPDGTPVPIEFEYRFMVRNGLYVR